MASNFNNINPSNLPPAHPSIHSSIHPSIHSSISHSGVSEGATQEDHVDSGGEAGGREAVDDVIGRAGGGVEAARHGGPVGPRVLSQCRQAGAPQERLAEGVVWCDVVWCGVVWRGVV